MLRSGPPVPGSLLRAACLARALGLAPYSLSSSGVYSASGRLRALSLAPALCVAGWSLAFMFAPLVLNAQSGLAQATGNIWKCIHAAQGLSLAWAAWWRLHPGLLPLLNSAAVRRGAAAVPLRYFAGVVLTPAVLGFLNLAVVMATPGGAELLPFGYESILFSYLVATVQFATSAYFAFLVHCVLGRFTDLNASLERSFERRRRGRHAEAQFKDVVAYLLGEHVKASSALDTLCHCFGLPMALECVMDFWSTVSFVYYVLEAGVSAVNISHAIWMVGLYGRWVYVFAVSSQTAAQGNDTLTIMNEFLAQSRDLTTEELTQLLVSCQILHQQRVRITVFGGYEISSKLFCQIVAAFVTYEVVLLQFESSCVAPNSNSTSIAN